MKKIIHILLLIVCCAGAMANNENPKSTHMSSGLVIKYKNHNLPHKHIDSVYIIIDKFDRTGSGIVRTVFFPGQNNEIRIPELKPGKYIVYIMFLGFHNEQFKKTVIVKGNRLEKLAVSLNDWEEYSKREVL